MIVSHALKLIFIKPMKVAGTSIEIALSRHCGEADIITPFGKKDEALRADLGFTGPRGYAKSWANMTPRDWAALAYYRKRPKIYLNHATAKDVQKTLPDEIWTSYLKVAVVRNPFDFAVSMYFWEQRFGPLPPFRQWLIETPEVLVRNRSITHINGSNAMDFMIRYEHLDEDLKILGDKLGLGDQIADDMKSIKTKSDKRPSDRTPQKMFEGFEEGLALVELLCAEDIRNFGYARP